MPTIFGGVSLAQFVRPLINILERLGTTDEITRKTLDDHSAKLRVSMPARVLSFDPLKQTIQAQPLIREKILNRETGQVEWRQLPVLKDVAVQFPQGTIGAITFPLNYGDEVLLLFQDRCYDSWWATGKVSNWNDRRFHDLSDAIAIPGINSVPRVIPGIAPDAIEMRSRTGFVRVGVSETFIRLIIGDFVSIITDGVMNINTGTLNIQGNLLINGEAYQLHEHSGVMNGSSNTGPVV